MPKKKGSNFRKIYPKLNKEEKSINLAIEMIFDFIYDHWKRKKPKDNNYNKKHGKQKGYQDLTDQLRKEFGNFFKRKHEKLEGDSKDAVLEDRINNLGRTNVDEELIRDEAKCIVAPTLSGKEFARQAVKGSAYKIAQSLVTNECAEVVTKWCCFKSIRFSAMKKHKISILGGILDDKYDKIAEKNKAVDNVLSEFQIETMAKVPSHKIAPQGIMPRDNGKDSSSRS